MLTALLLAATQHQRSLFGNPFGPQQSIAWPHVQASSASQCPPPSHTPLANQEGTQTQPPGGLRVCKQHIFSSSCCQLMIAMQKHRPGLPFPDFNAARVVYAVFFMVRGSQQASGPYVGISHRSVAECFEEHIRQAISPFFSRPPV